MDKITKKNSTLLVIEQLAERPDDMGVLARGMVMMDNAIREIEVRLKIIENELAVMNGRMKPHPTGLTA